MLFDKTTADGEYITTTTAAPDVSREVESHKTDLYECEDIYVSHPPHYQSESGLEVIDVIEAFTEGLEGIEAADTANIIKYACRWKKKNGAQDIQKIIWYATHLYNKLQEKESNNER